MARQFLVFSTICFSSLVLLGGASGTGKEIYNQLTTSGKAKQDFHDNTAAQKDCDSSSTSSSLKYDYGINLNDKKEKDTESEDDLSEYNANHLPMNLFNPVNSLSSLNMVKRAPNGFTGMRGKKQTEFTDYAQNTFDWNTGWDVDDSLVSPGRTMQDLANTLSDANAERFKKAPSAFYGVRGKKFSENYGIKSNNIEDLMRKVEEERLREELLQDFLDRISAATQYQNEIQKRAPSGFTGMRGKREMLNDMNDNDNDNEYLVLPNNEKRSSGNAFHGVRGKKDGLIYHQAFKRSPTQPLSFFGTRGKKQPFIDFRNKFVGVRGKKNFITSRTSAESSSSPLLNVQSLKNSPESQPSEENYAYDPQRRYFVDMFPMFFDTSFKRAPSGFLGMRGKRAT